MEQMNDGLGSQDEMKFSGQINWQIPLTYKTWANRAALRSRAQRLYMYCTQNNNEHSRPKGMTKRPSFIVRQHVGKLRWF